MHIYQSVHNTRFPESGNYPLTFAVVTESLLGVAPRCQVDGVLACQNNLSIAFMQYISDAVFTPVDSDVLCAVQVDSGIDALERCQKSRQIKNGVHHG